MKTVKEVKIVKKKRSENSFKKWLEAICGDVLKIYRVPSTATTRSFKCFFTERRLSNWTQIGETSLYQLHLQLPGYRTKEFWLPFMPYQSPCKQQTKIKSIICWTIPKSIPHICHFFYTGKNFGQKILHRRTR